MSGSRIRGMRLYQLTPMVIEVRACVIEPDVPWVRKWVQFTIRRDQLPVREDFENHDEWAEAVLALNPVK